MLNLQNLRQEVLLKQQAATNGATLTSDYVDCKGYREILLTLHGTTSDNATNNPATLRVTESDDTVATNFAAVAAFTGDGASGFTIPSSPTATTTAPFAQIHLDLRKRKRYLKLEVSPVTTQTFSLVATLGRAEEMPVGASEKNAAVVVNDGGTEA